MAGGTHARRWWRWRGVRLRLQPPRHPVPSVPAGVVGDWRQHFSPQQNARFNRRYQEEMGDVELPAPWPMD